MIIDSLEHFDQSITLAINSLNTGWTDQFWMLMSDKQVWFPAYAVIALMLFLRLGWKKALVVTCSIILTIVIADQISHAIKIYVERLRPCFNSSMLDKGLHWPANRGRNFFGFFSGHASNTFAFVACAVMGFRNDRTHSYNGFVFWGYIWAVLVSISRIMMAKHFLGDILAGMFFGLFVGYLVGGVTRFLIVRFIDRQRVGLRTFFPRRRLTA